MLKTPYEVKKSISGNVIKQPLRVELETVFRNQSRRGMKSALRSHQNNSRNSQHTGTLSIGEDRFSKVNPQMLRFNEESKETNNKKSAALMKIHSYSSLSRSKSPSKSEVFGKSKPSAVST